MKTQKVLYTSKCLFTGLMLFSLFDDVEGGPLVEFRPSDEAGLSRHLDLPAAHERRRHLKATLTEPHVPNQRRCFGFSSDFKSSFRLFSHTSLKSRFKNVQHAEDGQSGGS